MFGAVNQDKTLAMAALLQAGQCVVELAQKDQHDHEALTAVAGSVLELEANDPEVIFGGRGQLRSGLETLRTLFRATPTPAHKELIRYAVSMLQLSERLKRSSPMTQRVGEGIADIRQSEAESGSDDFYLALGQLYQETLSQLEPKIIVRGAKGKLDTLAQVSRVRAALFGGVRAAYLWHQLGGKRWHLMFARKAYVASAQDLLRV